VAKIELSFNLDGADAGKPWDVIVNGKGFQASEVSLIRVSGQAVFDRSVKERRKAWVLYDGARIEWNGDKALIWGDEGGRC